MTGGDLAASGPGGAANERTALAWQRTALALVAGAAILARLTWDRLGLFVLATLGVAVLLGGWVLGVSRARYQRDDGTRPGRRRSGRAPAALALATVLIAGVELVALGLR